MSEYNQALIETAKYLSPPVGFSNYETRKEDSKILIKQNNTILQLLVQIIEKLEANQGNNELILASSGILSSPKTINSGKWTYLRASLEETRPSSS